MELRDTIAERYATKHFDGRSIPEEKVRELLDVVRWAPSGLNIQPWRVKVVDDPAVKRELAEASFGEPQIESCSHLLVFCADSDIEGLTDRLLERMEEEGVPKENYEVVAGIAAEMRKMPPEAWAGYAVANTYLPALLTLLMAKDLGFDSCPMTHFQPEEYSRILELPENLLPTILCPLGYAADEPLPKWRYSVDQLLVP